MGWRDEDGPARIEIPSRIGSLETRVRNLDGDVAALVDIAGRMSDNLELLRRAVVLLCSGQTYEALDLVRESRRA